MLIKEEYQSIVSSKLIILKIPIIIILLLLIIIIMITIIMIGKRNYAIQCGLKGVD
jgi:ABC-type Na+ efflux pump permease subunit